MNVSEQIKILCIRSNISVSELARRVGTSPQNFNAKLKRETFTVSDLEKIAEVVDCTFERSFVLENGDIVNSSKLVRQHLHIYLCLPLDFPFLFTSLH